MSNVISQAETSQLRLALLTNVIPPFRKPLFQELGRRCKQLQVLISTPMEANRCHWQVDWEGLDVKLQKTATLTRRVGYNSSTDERQFVHFPIDTIPALLRLKPDAVLSSELGFRTIGAAVYRWLNPGSRLLTWVCVSESTETQRSAARHKFRRLLCKTIDGFLVNGASGTRYLRTLGVPANKIFLAPYPTDLVRFAAVEMNRPSRLMYRLLCISRFVVCKGLLPFLRLLAQWAAANPSRQIEFVLVGEGPLEAALRRFPLPPNVSLSIRACVPYHGIRAVYQDAGIFVFPTLADEWGTVTSEAMACGLPVLGSLESQAVDELVQDGITGWLFHPAQEEQVLSAIDRCLNTPPRQLREMRLAAKEAALRLSPERIAGQVLDAIKVCAAR